MNDFAICLVRNRTCPIPVIKNGKNTPPINKDINAIPTSGRKCCLLLDFFVSLLSDSVLFNSYSHRFALNMEGCLKKEINQLNSNEWDYHPTNTINQGVFQKYRHRVRRLE